MEDFTEEAVNYWEKTLKPQAMLCVPNYEDIMKINRQEIVGQDAVDLTVKIASTRIDPFAESYITDFINAATDAVNIREFTPTFIKKFIQVSGALTNPEYWFVAFQGDEESDEAQNLRKLAECLVEFARMLQ